MASMRASEASTSSALSTIVDPDPSSLRAAALLTLRSKRRRPESSQVAKSSLKRPKPPVALSLDYGHDDASSTNRTEAYGVQSNNDLDDAREEGEISDDVESSVASAAVPSSSVPSKSQSTSRSRTATPAMPFSGVEYRPPDPHNWTLPTSAAQSSAESPLRLEQADVTFDRSLKAPNSTTPLTEDQYELAKDLILDLLGWGVPPEYLMECGISSRTIYRVFTELRLRLPENLTFSETRNGERDLQQQSTARSVTQALASSAVTYSSPASTPIPILLKHPTRQSLPAPLPVNQALLDMEQNRRQELLARKAAVLASRQAKKSVSVNTASAISSQLRDSVGDANAKLVVRSDSVDEFLKTINPAAAHPAFNESKIDALLSLNDSPVAMDVDNESSCEIGVSTSQMALGIAMGEAAAPTSPASATSSSGLIYTKENNSNDPSNPSSLDADIHVPRSTTKRRTAMDYVDVRPASSNQAQANPLVPSKTASSAQFSLRNKLGGSFANIISARRLVIELSDSEDDDDTHRVQSTISPNLHSNAEVGLKATGSILLPLEIKIQEMKAMIAAREASRKTQVAFEAPISASTSRPQTPPEPDAKHDEDIERATSVGSELQGMDEKVHVSSNTSHASPAPTLQIPDGTLPRLAFIATPLISSLLPTLLRLQCIPFW